eukprot:6503263-Prymnesium_polylepis.1
MRLSRAARERTTTASDVKCVLDTSIRVVAPPQVHTLAGLRLSVQERTSGRGRAVPIRDPAGDGAGLKRQ